MRGTAQDAERIAARRRTIIETGFSLFAQHGIEIKHETVFKVFLTDLVSEFGITSVKAAISTADTLVHFADFSVFIPYVDENSLKSMITSWHNDEERSEIK